ncbi:MAG TPA: hypothetical protein DDZ60_03855 [Planktothrix sp. UBA10369]|jgi:hypothetical protein|nr:hypothetical protein [Microcoleaceae cyanobacterium UBA11344]HBK21656.1 hypothetical protein [Planktothrix sp. UBA10369]
MMMAIKTVYDIAQSELDKRLTAIEERLAKKPKRIRKNPTIAFELNQELYDELTKAISDFKLENRSQLMRSIVRRWLTIDKSNDEIEF